MSRNDICVQTGPNTISFDITYECTMSCLHCFNESGDTKDGLNELSDSEVMGVLKDLVKIKPSVICICGGEPLKRKRLVVEMVSYITKATDSKTVVNMVTNGELLDDEIASQLREAGIGSVQVSLDGHSSEVHDYIRNKKGSFDRAINALKILRRNKVSSAVACLPTRLSMKHLDEIIELCRNLDVRQFRMQPLMLMGRAKHNLQDVALNELDYRMIANKLKKYNSTRRSSEMSFQWGDPIDHMLTISRDGSSYPMFMGIGAYGDLLVSPYLPLSIGNLKLHSFTEYWQNGLSRCWEAPFIKELASIPKSSEKIEVNAMDSNLPEAYSDDILYLDVLETSDFFETTVEKIKMWNGVISNG